MDALPTSPETRFQTDPEKLQLLQEDKKSKISWIMRSNNSWSKTKCQVLKILLKKSEVKHSQGASSSK